MNRRAWDQIVSTAGLVVAIALIALGGIAVIGGNFGRANVRDQLEPQKVTFPPYEAMSAEEQETVGDFAGQQVLDGEGAKAFSDYIGGHLAEVNDGKTYAETSSEAREEGLDPDTAAELQGKADTLFRGETLRGLLLSAYGWWTVATMALWAGYMMILLGVVLLVFAGLGFWHSRKVAADRRAAAAPEEV